MEKAVLMGLAGVALVVMLVCNALINGFVAAWLIVWFVTPHAAWFTPNTYACAGLLALLDFTRYFGKGVPVNWDKLTDSKMTLLTNNILRPGTALATGYVLHWLAQ